MGNTVNYNANVVREVRRINELYINETEPGKQSQVESGKFVNIETDGRTRKLYALYMFPGYFLWGAMQTSPQIHSWRMS